MPDTVRTLNELNVCATSRSNTVWLLDHLHTDRPSYLDTRRHGAGVCPVVAFRDVPDLEGRAPGEVEPLIPVQDRISRRPAPHPSRRRVTASR